MGEVFRSRDRLTEEIVALKRALPEPVAPGLVTTAEAVSVETHTQTEGDADAGPARPASDSSGVATEHLSMSGVVNTPVTSTGKREIAKLALASEFRVLSSLRHPNIVSVLDYGFQAEDRKSRRLNSSHSQISYAVFCLKKKKTNNTKQTK